MRDQRQHQKHSDIPPGRLGERGAHSEHETGTGDEITEYGAWCDTEAADTPQRRQENGLEQDEARDQPR